MQEILLFLVGILVGAMNSVAGGGTIVGFPALIAVGLPPLVANATSHLMVLPGAITSAYGYRSYMRRLHKRYLILLIPCLIGGAIGAVILRYTSEEQFQAIVPSLVIFSVVLFAFQPLLHFHLQGHIHGKNKGLKALILLCIAFLPLAIYGGYFGAGFGFLMLAFLGFTKLNDIHQMNGLKNVGSTVIAIVSIMCLLDTGLIDWRYGLITAGGCAIGGYYGALIAQKIPTHAIRIIVIVIGVATAAYLAISN